MTKTDLFRVVIKIFGLYSLLILIAFIISDFHLFLDINGNFSIISTFLIFTIFSFLFSALLLFKADVIVKLFRLDKGYDDDKIMFDHVKSENAIRFALILVSVYLIITNMSTFILQVIYLFKTSVHKNTLETLIDTQILASGSYPELFLSGVIIAISFLIITNAKWLASKIEKTNK